MKLYYICDCCREIYQSQELEGPEGTAEIRGLCTDCQAELGQDVVPDLVNLRPLYH